MFTKESKIAKTKCAPTNSIFSSANCNKLGTNIMLGHSLFNQEAYM